MERLEKRFYSCYDPSRVYDFLGSSRKEEKLMGTGSHFSAYKLNVNGLELAIKVSSNTASDKSQLDLAELEKVLLKLKRLKLPLVPPMEIEFFNDYLLVVQPFAEKQIDRYSELWPVFQQKLEEFYKGLRDNDLALVDTIQGGISCEIPFIYDFSDLQVLKK